jgi:hypothetical protein
LFRVYSSLLGRFAGLDVFGVLFIVKIPSRTDRDCGGNFTDREPALQSRIEDFSDEIMARWNL